MTASSIRLSVIIACHQAAPHIRTCLDSILSGNSGAGHDDAGHDDAGYDEAGYDDAIENYDAIEVVAVDDASTDRTAAVLEEYAAADRRIIVVRLDRNVGPGLARNAGLDRATGDYVWFVDADDWLPPAAVRSVLDRLALHEADVLLVDHVELFANIEGGANLQLRRRTVDVLDGQAPAVPVRLAEQPALLRLAPSACTRVIRRGLLDETGLRFSPGRYEDARFSPLVMLHAARIDVLDEVCYCYRQPTAGSITTSPGPGHLDVFGQYGAVYADLDRFPGEGDLEPIRRQLFRVMIDHYLVILGHRTRLPASLRKPFFDRVVADYARWRPATGYPAPGGLAGVKHTLIRFGAYRAYSGLRWAFRLLPRHSPVRRGR